MAAYSSAFSLSPLPLGLCLLALTFSVKCVIRHCTHLCVTLLASFCDFSASLSHLFHHLSLPAVQMSVVRRSLPYTLQEKQRVTFPEGYYMLCVGLCSGQDAPRNLLREILFYRFSVCFIDMETNAQRSESIGHMQRSANTATE